MNQFDKRSDVDDDLTWEKLTGVANELQKVHGVNDLSFADLQEELTWEKLGCVASDLGEFCRGKSIYNTSGKLYSATDSHHPKLCCFVCEIVIESDNGIKCSCCSDKEHPSYVFCEEHLLCLQEGAFCYSCYETSQQGNLCGHLEKESPLTV